MNKSIINKLQKNIVPAADQLDKPIFFNGNGEKLRIMFVGNSITKHRPKPEIGWNNDCGMAASCTENDYVHQFLKKVREEYSTDISWAIVGAPNFERNLDPEAIDTYYDIAKDYNPDIMIMFFGANVPHEYDQEKIHRFKFGDSYEALRNYLAGDNTLVFHSEGFYIRPVLDNDKKEVAKKYGDTYISIDDIRKRVDTHGQFNHPNDLGMQEIAERFWSIIKPKLPKGD